MCLALKMIGALLSLPPNLKIELSSNNGLSWFNLVVQNLFEFNLAITSEKRESVEVCVSCGAVFRITLRRSVLPQIWEYPEQNLVYAVSDMDFEFVCGCSSSR